MLHVLLKHPYSNSLSNRLLRRKSVSCKNIRWPETKCISVCDEKMPLSPAGNIIHSALKMYWEKGLQQRNPCHELGVRNFAVYVHGHLLLDASKSFLILFIFMISNVLCTHAHMKTYCRGLHYSMLINRFQNISLSCPRTQVTFFCHIQEKSHTAKAACVDEVRMMREGLSFGKFCLCIVRDV